jgi:hypothetical protein
MQIKEIKSRRLQENFLEIKQKDDTYSLEVEQNEH